VVKDGRSLDRVNLGFIRGSILIVRVRVRLIETNIDVPTILAFVNDACLLAVPFLVSFCVVPHASISSLGIFMTKIGLYIQRTVTMEASL